MVAALRNILLLPGLARLVYDTRDMPKNVIPNL